MALHYQKTARELLKGDDQVLIRIMTEEDIPLVRKYNDEADAQLAEWNEQRLPGSESIPGGPWTEDDELMEHFKKYQRNGGITLLAEDTSGRVIGFADLWRADEPAPFGLGLNLQVCECFQECHYLGLLSIFLEEAEKVARAAKMPALDVRSDQLEGHYPTLRRLGMKLFYENDSVACRCPKSSDSKRLESKVIDFKDADVSGLLRVGHWCANDFSYRTETDNGLMYEITWNGHRALLELWCWDNELADSVSVPENAPTNSEIFVNPEVFKSPAEMSILLRECATLAGELGAEEIGLPCPCDPALDDKMLDIVGREFAFDWFRKQLDSEQGSNGNEIWTA